MLNQNFNIQKNKELCLEVFGNEAFKECGFVSRIFSARNSFTSKGSLELLPLFFENLSKGKTFVEHELKTGEKDVVEK